VAITEAAQAERELAEDLERLRGLVEAGRVEDARRLAPELAAKWPESPALQHFARVLEPPRILPSRPEAPDRRFDRDYQWLREHAAEYPGCWIATYEDRLIAADPDVERVLAEVRETLDTERETAFLHYQPATRE